MSDSLETMALRDKLSEADRLARELIHHLEHGFIPKAHILRRTARQGCDPDDPGDVTDVTIRSTVETVLSADQFSRQVTEQLDKLLAAIRVDAQRASGS